MRRNLPVTDNEYVLTENDTIVTKTDLRGKITYVNDDFIRISGFTPEELIGSPHNIVRHPDMPPAAFADMWRTLQAGKAWSGLVKNRCKNGDFYWVQANAAPLYENGQLSGYTSIRLKPAREAVAAADAAYARIRAGDQSLYVYEGAAYRHSVLGRWRRKAQLSLAGRILASQALLALCFGAGLALALSGHPTAAAWPCGAGVLLALLSGWLVRGWAVAPLHGIRAEIDRMSTGDLSAVIEVKGRDELAAVRNALRVLQTNVKVLVGQIREVTTVVTAGTAEIAQGNEDLSSRSEAAAQALEETAASMEEITGTVRNNADNAIDAQRLVGVAADTARQGGDAVHNVVGTMQRIEESSRRIADIIGVIDSIAFQTNILALNAAVEAARAGEQGRGFAVVASEVRTLAQRSATAAREIKQLIDDSVARVAQGASQVDDAGRTIDGVVQQVRNVAEYMNEISIASREQSQGIEQVNRAIIELDKVTQQNARLVVDGAAASSHIKDQALQLAQLVSSFRLHPNDRHGAAVVSLAPRVSATTTAPRRDTPKPLRNAA